MRRSRCLMVNHTPQHAAIDKVLATVMDPELPCNIIDLGLVEQVAVDARAATVKLIPTFTGCPALDMIADDVQRAVTELPEIDECTIEWLFEPAWSPDRITDSGRASLRSHGVTVPEHGSPAMPADGTTPLRTSAIPCPWCGSTNTRLDSSFGPTRCRTIQYCDDCQNTFEDMKRLKAD